VIELAILRSSRSMRRIAAISRRSHYVTTLIDKLGRLDQRTYIMQGQVLTAVPNRSSPPQEVST
jgi:hypothetical protein